MIELLVTLSVLGIMMGIGIPSFRNFIANQRAKSAAFEVMSSAMIARSEAVKRRGNVTVTPTTGTDWSTGWAVTAAGGVAVYSQDPLTSVTVTTYTDSTCATAGSVATLVFNFSGRPASSACFKLTSSGGTTSRCVKVDSSGIASAGSCP